MTKVASFDIHYHQFLDENGKLTQSLPQCVESNETLVELYRLLVEIRAFDQKAISLQRTGKMGTYAPIHGQEAISTAIGHAMAKDDVLVPYYRDYGAQIQRGMAMWQIYQYWGGDERGSFIDGKSKDFPISVPIASQCLHATGVAYAFKYRKQPNAVVTCIGEGGTSEGDFYEAINVAGAWNLPVVFVVNNNQWAISVPRDKQTQCETFAQKAIAAGIEGVQVDGNDIIAMRHTLEEKLNKAREGNGPTVIEAMTYRLCDHTTADDATRYQCAEETERAKDKEPIKRFRNYLIEQGLWNDDKEAALIQQAKDTVQAAVDNYLAIDKPSIASMFDYHYEELPDSLHQQKEIALGEEENHA